MCLDLCKKDRERGDFFAKELSSSEQERAKVESLLALTDQDKASLAAKLQFQTDKTAALEVQNEQLDTQLDLCHMEVSNNAYTIDQLKASLATFVNPEKTEMDKDYPQSQKYYEKRYVLDEYSIKRYSKMAPQEFLVSPKVAWHLSQHCAQIVKLYDPQTEDAKVRAAWAYIRSRSGASCNYRSDDYYGTPWNDFWQYPHETIMLQKGDCEDLAMLWWSLAYGLGVPAYKIRCHLGLYGTGGHCYGVYKPAKDKQELLIEATMYGEMAPLTTLESHPEYSSYFAFNNELMWKVKDGVEFGKLVEMPRALIAVD